MAQVGMHEAKTKLSQLVERAGGGEDIVIARNGDPVARLVPIETASGPGAGFLAARGSLAGQISISKDFELTDDEIDEMLRESA